MDRDTWKETSVANAAASTATRLLMRFRRRIREAAMESGVGSATLERTRSRVGGHHGETYDLRRVFALFDSKETGAVGAFDCYIILPVASC
jgi:hypothetical protein